MLRLELEGLLFADCDDFSLVLQAFKETFHFRLGQRDPLLVREALL